MVACHQGTRIDAAVSKSASLKKQVARRLSDQRSVNQWGFYMFIIGYPASNSKFLADIKIFLQIYILKLIQNSWTSNFVLVFLS